MSNISCTINRPTPKVRELLELFRKSQGTVGVQRLFFESRDLSPLLSG